MIKYSVDQIVAFSAIVWAAFAVLSFALPADKMFWFIHPVAVSLGVTVITVYARGFVDAWRHRREGITLAHLLTFGVTLMLIGSFIRSIRWYITGEIPTGQMDIDFHLYNWGVWTSMWGALFILGAGTLDRPYKFGTLSVIFLAVLGFMIYLEHVIWA